MRKELKQISSTIDQNETDLNPNEYISRVQNPVNYDDNEENKNEMKKLSDTVKNYKALIADVKSQLETNENRERIGEVIGEIKMIKSKITQLKSDKNHLAKILGKFGKSQESRMKNVPEKLSKANNAVTFAKDKFRKLRDKCNEEEKVLKDIHTRYMNAEKAKRIALQPPGQKRSQSVQPNPHQKVTQVQMESAQQKLITTKKDHDKKLVPIQAKLDKIISTVDEQFTVLKEMRERVKEKDQEVRVNALRLQKMIAEINFNQSSPLRRSQPNKLQQKRKMNSSMEAVKGLRIN